MVVETWKKTGIATKFPTYRTTGQISEHSWLVGKRLDDEAEGLWRIYDTIYDLTDFVDKHPGGAFWLRETKGTDITEAFEAHHISTLPAKMLENYKVREAAKPRIYTLTLHEDGFYKTLKRRVREKLKSIDYKPSKWSDYYNILLLVATFATIIASGRINSWLLVALAGLTLCWCIISAHNYFHRRDNWRMYTFNLCLMNFYTWRVVHALSHHIYPNTFFDLELVTFEPYLCWVPNPYIKSIALRWASLIVEPIIYSTAFIHEILGRIVYSVRKQNIMHWHDLIGLTIPLSLFIFTDLTLLMCLRQWFYIITAGSIAFTVIGLNAAHHDPNIYHEGDAMREDRDWGLFQVDSIIDRGDLKVAQFLVLTHFGDHILHHLFPTLDHGILPQLYPILYETLDEFKAQLREQNHFQHMIGQHKQLFRITPNLKPPGSGK